MFLGGVRFDTADLDLSLLRYVLATPLLLLLSLLRLLSLLLVVVLVCPTLNPKPQPLSPKSQNP